MTNATFVMGLMLAASAILGPNGCPEPTGGPDGFETGDEDSGDGSLGDGGSDTSGYVDPDPNLGLVGNDEALGETGETGETGDACGDFTVQPGEACDGWNINFETCLAFGFVGGQLACNDDCTFDVSNCVAPGCGNGIIETTEICDGSPYPCWVLGYAGSTDPDGMTPCGADCTPNESACVATCEWGQPGCFCSATTPCPDAYICAPHPQGWENAPGTCQLAACKNVGTVCVPRMTAGGDLCCPGLECIDSLCG